MAKILIIEDSRTQMVILESMLKEANHIVLTAHSGETGLEIARLERPDLLITDIRMPNMNGYEVSWNIKNDFILKHTPVILLSELSETQDIITGLESLADSYIIKPYNKIELLNSIDFLLSNPQTSTKREPLTIVLEGNTHPIHSSRRQILSFLLSTYDTVTHRNKQLLDVQTKLRTVNEALSAKSKLLEASESRFRCLVETAPDIIYRIDNNGNISFINQSVRKLGYEPNELINKHFSCLIAPEQIDKISRNKVLSALKTDQNKTQPKLFDERRAGERRTSGLEILFKVKNSSQIVSGILHPLEDEYINMEVSSAGMYHFDDNKEIFIGTVGVIRDITDRKIAEKNLEQARLAAIKANRAKSDFLSKMSHELRTPLNAILGFSQLLRTDMEDQLSPGQNESIVYIHEAGQHLLELINDILDLSAIEAGKVNLDLGLYEPNLFLAECINMTNVLANKHNITFSYKNLIKDDFCVEVDVRRIKQVILNLLSNAIKYNRAGGSVVLTCKRMSPQQFRLSIEDTGKGMSAEYLNDIFQPFSRAESTKDIEGTGIGLAITEQLVKAMHGQISVSSEVGVGSIFHVDLPICNASPTFTKDE